MAMLLGKKIGMTRIYDDAGSLVPATVVQAGPCVVTQIKTVDTDGYNAVQIGFDDVKPSRCKKPQTCHAKKANTTPKRFVREIRLTDTTAPEVNLGDALTVDVFSAAERVDVVGTSKGKGFAGCMKRHGFGGFPASHGCERKHRAPGSIASHCSNAGTGPGPKKGKRMAGHMGTVRVTSKNHSLLAVDSEKNLLVVKGAIAGAAGSYCIIKSSR
jgi:large subunit ribosomal protein L3